ncbi:hypothetical protein [Aliarcobacter butzleri]|uniref:hypothetical protein n=1 Tax=Aliarcobacter butzleri TaxID=28197 RepID=UPI001269F276|nr:hypothetical protein [Aliarcobacter butzleri]
MEKEIVEQSFNWIAFIIAFIVFLIVFFRAKKELKRTGQLEESQEEKDSGVIVALFAVPTILSIGIYFLISSIG